MQQEVHKIPLCVVFAQNPEPQYNNKKTLHTQTEKHSTKELVFSIQNCKGHEKQRKAGEIFQIKRE